MPNKNGHLPRIVQVAILVCVSFIYWHVWHIYTGMYGTDCS